MHYTYSCTEWRHENLLHLDTQPGSIRSLEQTDNMLRRSARLANGTIVASVKYDNEISFLNHSNHNWKHSEQTIILYRCFDGKSSTDCGKSVMFSISLPQPDWLFVVELPIQSKIKQRKILYNHSVQSTIDSTTNGAITFDE